MITFIVAIILLVVGYFTYGKYIDKMFGPNKERPTPAYDQRDDVIFTDEDTINSYTIVKYRRCWTYIWTYYGSTLWTHSIYLVVVGCIFAGAVHDYLTGMISIRNKGAHAKLQEIFRSRMKHFVNIFSILLLLLTGTVFVSPALLLHNLWMDALHWVFIFVIFVYYTLSTICTYR